MTRVRFAPSPTGALHIGGIRTALYNYLWAKKQGGTFILRVEDTDQTRYVPGAEEYIVEALEWLGLRPDESPMHGGPHAPYRQSERKEKGIYKQYVDQLLANGKAYYAFDTDEELTALRKAAEAEKRNFSYNAVTRLELKNSLTLSAEETQARIASGEYVVRLLVTPNEEIHFTDLVRGEVKFNSNEVDDKVLLKSDGMPTYHLANVVDDRLMEITHVIRGEEWLPSTPMHLLLYRAFGWQAPAFCHLPLILRPDGKGKLSKRDGAKFGIPVFPLDFQQPNNEVEIKGFREWGFEPAAVLNFLALLGWATKDAREVLSLPELIEAFDLADVHKAGARFDFNKAKWFNQQYLMHESDEALAAKIRPFVEKAGVYGLSDEYLRAVSKMLKERVYFLTEYYQEAKYFYQPVDFEATDLKEKIAATTQEDARKVLEQSLKKLQDAQEKIKKNWASAKPNYLALADRLRAAETQTEQGLHDAAFAFMGEVGLKTGEVLPLLRIALSGSLQGPSVFEMMALFGAAESYARLQRYFAWLDK